MVCTSCGTDNDPGRLFCREGGAPLRAPCQSGGAANDPTDKFCGGCGASLRGLALCGVGGACKHVPYVD